MKHKFKVKKRKDSRYSQWVPEDTVTVMICDVCRTEVHLGRIASDAIFGKSEFAEGFEPDWRPMPRCGYPTRMSSFSGSRMSYDVFFRYGLVSK